MNYKNNDNHLKISGFNECGFWSMFSVVTFVFVGVDMCELLVIAYF